MNKTTSYIEGFSPERLYNRYNVMLEILDRIDGGTPKDPNLIEGWIKAKTGFDDARTAEIVAEHKLDPDKAAALLLEERKDAQWCGFRRDAIGHFIETRQLKAMMREALTNVGFAKKRRGSRNVMQHGVEVRGHKGGPKVYLTDHEGQPLGDPMTEERPIHVQTPQGPRSALTKTDYFGPGTTVLFEIWVLGVPSQEERSLNRQQVVDMLTFAQQNGIGANRSQGSGKFRVVLFEEVGSGALPK